MKIRHTKVLSLFEIRSEKELRRCFRVTIFAFLCLETLCIFLFLNNQASNASALDNVRNAYIQQSGDQMLFFPCQIRQLIDQIVNECANYVTNDINAKEFATSATLINTVLNAAFSTFLKKKDSRRFGIPLSAYKEYSFFSQFAKCIRVISVFLIALSFVFLAFSIHFWTIFTCVIVYCTTTLTIIINFAVYSDSFWHDIALQKYSELICQPMEWKKHCSALIDAEQLDHESLTFICEILANALTHIHHVWETRRLDQDEHTLLSCLLDVLKELNEVCTRDNSPYQMHQSVCAFLNRTNDDKFRLTYDTYVFISLTRYIQNSSTGISSKAKPIIFEYLRKENAGHLQLFNYCKRNLLDAYLYEPDSTNTLGASNRKQTPLLGKELNMFEDLNSIQ